jgi:hypothetical protein
MDSISGFQSPISEVFIEGGIRVTYQEERVIFTVGESDASAEKIRALVQKNFPELTLHIFRNQGHFICSLTKRLVMDPKVREGKSESTRNPAEETL